MLTPPNRQRERILLMGPWGAGKSTAWSDIYAWLQRGTPDDGQPRPSMFVIDTDNVHDRVCPELPEDHVRVVEEMPDYIEAAREFRKLATTDDWLIVDRVGEAWQAAQDYYIKKKFGVAAADLYLEWNLEHDAKDGNPLGGSFGQNWDVVNRQYNELMKANVLRWPGHVLCCTGSKAVQLPNRKGEGGDDPLVIAEYGRYGVKPVGQKDLAFQFPTVIYMIPKGPEEWAYSSIKEVGMRDASRERPQNKTLKSFTLDYLVVVAKWTV